MHKTLLLLTLTCILLLALGGTAGAQTPPLPTYTPYPTPTAIPSLLDRSQGQLPWWLAGLAGLVFGGILVWLLRPAFEKLGNALAEALSHLGSGWGFRRRYLTHLIEEYRGLNIRGLKTRAPVTVELEQVYVSLHAQVPDVALGRQGPPPMDIGRAMTERERLAILGGPGTGKTTLLAYLTLTYARNQARKRLGLREKRLPVLVPLRKLRDALEGEDAVSTLPAYLTRWYEELGLHPRERFFERVLERGSCLVLLDGLDEVADEAERRRMAEWVDRLVTIYPRNRYVVTSRPPGYESAPLENGFTVLRIRDLTAGEVRQFAANWCLAVELAAQGEDNPTVRRRGRDAARDLVGAIEANADIRRLAVNPLLLSIIALVHRYRARLPRRRVDLYAECVDVLLGHWDAAKGLVGRLSPGQRRAMLQPLALRMHQQERRDLPRGKLEGQIAALLPQVGGEAADAAGFIDEVRERSGLLVETSLGTYAFSHMTFQEYLAAREVVEKEEQRGLLLEKSRDEWWQEVALLYAGMTDATPLVDALLASADGETWSDLLLAGRCVAEAVRLEEETRAQVIRLLERTFATCTGELFLRTGEVLAGIAGEDGVDFFLGLAHDDEQRREAALWALGEMARQPNEALRERVLARLQGAIGGLDDSLLLAFLHADWGPPLSLTLAARLDGRMVQVPAGDFLMGDEKRRRYVAAFCIDRYPVTNAQYWRFVEATGREPPRYWEGGSFSPERAVHPVVNVSWHDAAAYAAWAGKRLPTEEEWEKAARGTDGRKYPWGDEFDPAKCNTSASGLRDTTPVGRYSPAGDGPYGCADMAGNVWEWTDSWWDRTREVRVLRGGSWNSYREYARCAYRFRSYPNHSFNFIGFRCVSPVCPDS